MCSIPLLTGWYSQKKTQNVLATYEQIVEQTTGDEIEQLRNQADEYNKKLWAESKGVREQSEPDQMEEYEGLLNAENRGRKYALCDDGTSWACKCETFHSSG